MNDFKKESPTQNKQNSSEHINSAFGHQTTIKDTTSQMKVSSKIEITISPMQLAAAKWLFHQYDLKPPTWLRQKFLIDQRRRKTLNVELVDAQLDRVYCGKPQNDLDWDGLLHELWHQINGVPSCK
jgi:hypothetical protein